MRKVHHVVRMLLATLLMVVTATIGVGSLAYAQSTGGRIDSVNKYTIPSQVGVGEPVTVNVSINALPCVPPFSASVALVIDKSGSMDGTPLAEAKNAAALFVDTLDFSRDQASVVAFSGDGFDGDASNDADTLSTLSQDRGVLQNAISSISVDNRTNISEGLRQGGATLASAPADNAQALVLLTDGLANIDSTGYDSTTADQDALDIADTLKSQGIRIYTIGLGSVDETFLRSIASAPGLYYPSPSPSDLPEVYAQIARTLLADIGTDATFTETYDMANFEVIAGSQVPSGGVLDTTTGTITWDFPNLSSRQGVSYQVMPLPGVLGDYDISTATTITYTQADTCPQAGQAIDFSAAQGAPVTVSNSETPLPPKPANVSVTITSEPNVTIGTSEIFTLTITATNNGKGDADDTEITLPFDPNLVSVLDATFSRGSGWVSQLNSDSIVMNTGHLDANGDSVSATVRFEVNASAAVGETIRSQADFTWSDKASGGSGTTNATYLTVSDGSTSVPFFALEVTPFNGPAGTTHDFRGTFFAPGEPVAFWYDTPAGDSVEVGRVTADSNGVAETSLDTSGLPPGTYTMVAYGIWSHITAVGVFQVE
ncbi:VWA domain-containing protein [Chloroflexales bacterium ZM16-3]|nr:VWA domain-containing protein [Chloroflexales bacterium ZM16-3]